MEKQDALVLDPRCYYNPRRLHWPVRHPQRVAPPSSLGGAFFSFLLLTCGNKSFTLQEQSEENMQDYINEITSVINSDIADPQELYDAGEQIEDLELKLNLMADKAVEIGDNVLHEYFMDYAEQCKQWAVKLVAAGNEVAAEIHFDGEMASELSSVYMTGRI